MMLGALPLRRLGDDIVNRSGEEEILLVDAVVLAFDDLLEAANRLGDWHVLTVDPGELLRDEERLRQEPLNLARARYREPVVFRQLVDAENGDDVLQILVALQNLLHGPGDVVVLVAEDPGIENTRRGRQRIDGR